MILKLSVLVFSVLQIAAAAFLSLGTFETETRDLSVYVQPAGWTFGVWGVIYALSLVYGVYQILPGKDNQLVMSTRFPALIAFGGSIMWLWLAGFDNGLVWLTIPVLFSMAIALTHVVVASEKFHDRSTILFSKLILLPYAAWTAIACWLNIPVLLIDQSVVTSGTINYILNLAIFACIAGVVIFFYKKSNKSVWYGAVVVWATIGIFTVNYTSGNYIFAVAAAALGMYVVIHWLLYRSKRILW